MTGARILAGAGLLSATLLMLGGLIPILVLFAGLVMVIGNTIALFRG